MKKILKLSIFAVLCGGLIAGYILYRKIYKPVIIAPASEIDFFIKSGWDEDDVLKQLESQGFVKEKNALDWIIKKKNYTGRNVVPGKYVLYEGMTAPELIDHLRAGRGEEDVKVIFNASRTLEDLAGQVASSIEADSVQLIELFNDDEQAEKYGFDKASFKSMFLPDTYFFDWDTDANEFLERMASEYRSFWNENRLSKARNIELSQSEVTTLSSIVQAEQQIIPSERPRIAGLYLNRLRIGMRLQSDPTVIYALGNFSKRRVLKKDLSVDSPYNTYKYKGLPPGPINIPSKQSIDAVLNAEKHNYIYMCAKADFSGYHAFAKDLRTHNANARAFQTALNDRKIYN